MPWTCRNRWNRLLTLLVLAACAGRASADQEVSETGKCLLWRVRSPAATVYLLGSLHFAKPALYPLDPSIEGAFDRSDFLVVEINLTPARQRKLATLAAAKGLYLPGQTIENDLSQDTLNRLKAFLQARGMTVEQVKQMRPWLLAVTLMQQETARAGYSPKLGIDRHFIDRAVAARKEILELETVESQAALMAAGPKGVHEPALREKLDQLPTLGDTMATLTKAWLAGDAGAIDRINQENRPTDPALLPQFKKRVEDRNVRMAARVEAFLKTGKTYFVVVGCMHLVGENGIVRLLRSRGHRVEQLEKARKR